MVGMWHFEDLNRVICRTCELTVCSRRGNILMDQHSLRPYPIPIINGFTVTAAAFKDLLDTSPHLTWYVRTLVIHDLHQDKCRELIKAERWLNNDDKVHLILPQLKSLETFRVYYGPISYRWKKLPLPIL